MDQTSNTQTVAMDAKTKKMLKVALNYAGIDKLMFKRDGTCVAKRGYFYRHGQSASGFADRITATLEKQDIHVEIVSARDDWNAWPKDSNFVVTFKMGA